jgi:hypothetical protein
MSVRAVRVHSELVERASTGVGLRHGEYRCLSLGCNGFGGSGSGIGAV